MPDFIGQLCVQLLDQGCPVGRMRRVVREVADHREDLVLAGQEEGLSLSEAGARADLALGNPKTLAENMMTAIRRSSRCGRHPFVAFALLPVLTFPLCWGLMMALNLGLGFALGFGWDAKRLHLVTDNPAKFHYVLAAFQIADHAAIGMVVFLFCVLAIRSAVDQTWMLVTSAVCSVYAMFIYATIGPRIFTAGVSSKPNWLHAAVPLVVLGLVHVYHRWQLRKASKLMDA